MSAYQLHVDGDCGDSCPVCANECDVCGRWLIDCTCPTLPLDEECSTCDGTGLVDWCPGQHRDSEDDQQPCPDCPDGRENARLIGREEQP